jgi:hypothetical protein
VARDAAIPVTTALEGQLRGVGDRLWAKPETAAQKTGMGTVLVPIRGPVCLFLVVFGLGVRLLLEESLLSCQLVELFEGEKAGSISLLMSL